MNYQYTTSGSLQPMSASISLPPISSIDFHAQQIQRTSPDVVQPLPPPPPAAPRVLPPLPYPYAVRPAPPPPPPMVHDYMHARPIYSGMPSPYHHMPGRMPLPSTSDPNLIVAPTRHKAKEVKRRTKTGCLTCRKRRIKVSVGFFRSLICISSTCCKLSLAINPAMAHGNPTAANSQTPKLAARAVAQGRWTGQVYTALTPLLGFLGTGWGAALGVGGVSRLPRLSVNHAQSPVPGLRAQGFPQLPA